MEFQGFQHIISPVLIVIAALFLAGLSWYAYRKFTSLTPWLKWTLISLRASALLLLLFLLLNPYFYSEREADIPPKIAVFLDNSESIGIQKGDYDGLQSYRNVLQDISFENLGNASISYFSIGEEVRPFFPDSLNASEQRTNLSAPVTSLLDMEEDVEAAVFITDGIITFGRNPAISAFNSAIPIYTVAIGDTSRVRDVSVTNVVTNSTGYTNTIHAIEAEISQTGFANNTVNVRLESNGEVLQDQQITFDTDNQLKQVSFELELTEAGLKQYEIRVEPLPDEWTDSNNNSVFSIDVLDSKTKILHVAYQIHPDVKAVRSVIERDESNELTTLTWLGENNFIEELPDTDEEFDLIVIQGFPTDNRPFRFLDELDNTPTLLFSLSPNVGNISQQLRPAVLIDSRDRRTVPVLLYQLLDERDHPILELSEINLLETPYLQSPLRASLEEPQSTALFNVLYDGIETDYPAIAVSEIGNIRRSQVLPWGWFKFTQSINQSHREFAVDLISNLIAWTSSDPDNRLLRISPQKQSFSTAEHPFLGASLQNEQEQPEEDAIIEIEIAGPNGQARSFNMENAGNGNYRLDLPRLSEGLYEYEATARKGDRELDRQNGEFLVSNSSMELTNTIRNDKLLQDIAKNSGGAFFTFNEAASLRDSLQAAKLLEMQTETIENYFFPVRSIFWFLIVIVLLAGEWFLRKYASLP
ncbi:hypothetical protein [Gracilimonas tropica]|uniref:hypothetical protein n=1 Tax=Gracilimonas tropica TaxID=454600 RepID=UPI000378FFE8|nr:hypothetical protein [Gracilimonas tropica]